MKTEEQLRQKLQLLKEDLARYEKKGQMNNEITARGQIEILEWILQEAR